MLLSEKLKNIIKNSPHKKVFGFHRALVDKFGKDAISQKTLFRALNNESSIRESSLYQIGMVLNMTVAELRTGTETEDKLPDYEGIIKYRYGATLYKIKSKELSYEAGKIKFIKGGTSDIAQDDPTRGPCTKFIWGWYGSVDIYQMDPLKRHLNKLDKANYNIIKTVQANTRLHFLKNFHVIDSSIPHFFRNSSERSPAGVLVIQHPKQV